MFKRRRPAAASSSPTPAEFPVPKAPPPRAEIVYSHTELHGALENTRQQFAAAYQEAGSFPRTLALAVCNSVAANLMNAKLFRAEAMINNEPCRFPTLAFGGAR